MAPKKYAFNNKTKFSVGFVMIWAKIITFRSFLFLRKIKDKPHSIRIVRLNERIILIRLFVTIFLSGF